MVCECVRDALPALCCKSAFLCVCASEGGEGNAIGRAFSAFSACVLVNFGATLAGAPVGSRAHSRVGVGGTGWKIFKILMNSQSYYSICQQR